MCVYTYIYIYIYISGISAAFSEKLVPVTESNRAEMKQWCSAPHKRVARATIQRRLARPLRKDDTHKSRSVNNFALTCKRVARAACGNFLADGVFYYFVGLRSCSQFSENYIFPSKRFSQCSRCPQGREPVLEAGADGVPAGLRQGRH